MLLLVDRIWTCELGSSLVCKYVIPEVTSLLWTTPTHGWCRIFGPLNGWSPIWRRMFWASCGETWNEHLQLVDDLMMFFFLHTHEWTGIADCRIPFKSIKSTYRWFTPWKKNGVWCPANVSPSSPAKKQQPKLRWLTVASSHANAEPDGTTRIGKGEDSADSGWMG